MNDSPESMFFGFESFDPNKPEAINDNSYLGRLYHDVTNIMQAEFTPIYVKPEQLKSITLLPSRAGLQRQDHIINLDARRVTQDTRQLPIEQQRAQFLSSDIVMNKRLVDAITLFHELCHEIYETINPPPDVREVEDSVDRMISEGFATFMDIYFMDILSERPDLLGLQAIDLQTLKDAKKIRIERLKKLRHRFPHRTEGTLLIHRIYKSAKNDLGDKPNGGLQGIRSYIDSTDRILSLTTPRESFRFIHDSLPHEVQSNGTSL